MTDTAIIERVARALSEADEYCRLVQSFRYGSDTDAITVVRDLHKRGPEPEILREPHDPNLTLGRLATVNGYIKAGNRKMSYVHFRHRLGERQSGTDREIYSAVKWQRKTGRPAMQIARILGVDEASVLRCFARQDASQKPMPTPDPGMPDDRSARARRLLASGSPPDRVALHLNLTSEEMQGL